MPTALPGYGSYNIPTSTLRFFIFSPHLPLVAPRIPYEIYMKEEHKNGFKARSGANAISLHLTQSHCDCITRADTLTVRLVARGSRPHTTKVAPDTVQE